MKKSILFKTTLQITVPITVICLTYGLYLALLASPQDYQQGDLVRIMYIHVPFAWISLLIYSFMTFCSILFLVKRNLIICYIHAGSVYIGSLFTILTLITGSIWGKDTWGTWWVWDARIITVFILLLFYLSNLLIIKTSKKILISAIPTSVFTIIGFINVPMIKFSVYIWNSLHQKSTMFRYGGPSIDSAMLLPLIIMSIGLALCAVILITIKSKSIITKSTLI